ncbi:MAG: hypothetical protein PHE03_01990 [Bacteroidales bacterium]|nr:hypothetical protein [Bacteroidales bacterium]MDD3891055.1 hypothetical protein [Bacteroidales bacterium]
MELDSIIFIVIAIVLAIVNAVAQKKKKDQQKQTAHKVVRNPEHYVPDEEGLTVAHLENEGNEHNYDPFGLTHRHEGVPTSFKADEFENDEDELQEEVKLTAFQLKMQERAQASMQGGAGERHKVNEFDDDSIASTEIGNAKTQEEEELAFGESRNYFVKEFDAKKAIVYSEIIRPKYFSI